MEVDESFLREALTARDHLEELQHEVERSRLTLHQSVRRLHASGASMREIADALGISHQRVHQIVNGGGEMATPTRRRGVLSRLVSRRTQSCDPSRRGAGPAGLTLDRLDVDAREAMSLAAAEARGLHHSYLGTEHVLLGLLRTDHGLAARLLSAIDADLERSRTAVRNLLGEAPLPSDTGPGPSDSDMRPTERTKQVLEVARNEARSLHSTHVRGEHLLLGLAREGGGLGARILADLGVGYHQLRGRIIRAALVCSFCGRSGLDVACLVAGPGVHICERCIQAASRPPEPGSPLSSLPEDGPASCSFCLRKRAEVERIGADSAAAICEACLAICREIEDEQRKAFIPGRG